MPTTEKELNYSELVVPYDSNKYIMIEFDKIFGIQNISHMNKLELHKRSYYSIAELICESIVRVFEECEENAVLPYLSVLYKIRDTKRDYPFIDFKKDIINTVNNESVKLAISNYIDQNYVNEMDDKTEEMKQRKKINHELQFTDEHVKILLEIAESIRISIPLVTNYAVRFGLDINDTLYIIFKEIIMFYEEDIELLNKIHRFIYSRVVSTQYSDKTIWSLLTNKSKDVNVITMEFFKDIIIGILPKTIFDKNIVNLLHVVIKRKINFEFSKNYKLNFKPVNLNQVDSEGLTQFDKWEISMNKENEAKTIINQISIKHQINNIKQQFGVSITKNEFKYYKENIQINSFQTNILFLFFAKYSSYSNLNSCSLNEYIMLLICFYKWLVNNNYPMLAKYIIGRADVYNEKRINSRNSKTFEKMIHCKAYNQLLKNKFYYIKENLAENNYLIKMVGSLIVSKYMELNPYNIYKETGEIFNGEIKTDVERIADEILNFFKII